MFLNLGCGKLRIKDCINVDFNENSYADELVDLLSIPWKWGDESIDGIFMIHALEHFPDQFLIIKECYRVLKKGGFLYLQVPHPTNCTAVGNMGHFRTFSLSTLTDFLCLGGYYPYFAKLFKNEIQEIRWLNIPRNHEHPYVNFETIYPTTTAYKILRPVNFIINKLIRVNYALYERWWWTFVGGADEIVWKGVKV